jgi:hypothetical protein
MCSFTYQNPPIPQNRWVLTAILFPTLWATLLPLLYRLHRQPEPDETIMPRVARRSALAALYLAICMGLRLIGALSWANAVLLLVLLVLTEVVVSTR